MSSTGQQGRVRATAPGHSAQEACRRTSLTPDRPPHYGSAWVTPGIETAPVPGRSAAESTRALKLGGMQKMLTSVAGFGAPPVVRAPAGEPVSAMVRVTSSHGLDGDPMPQKAPAVRCWHFVKLVTLAQSASVVQGMPRHVGAPPHAVQAWPGLHPHTAPDATPPQRRADWLATAFRQNPQNTFGWVDLSAPVWVTVPVSRTKEIGSAPMFFAGGGGQSWLVG